MPSPYGLVQSQRYAAVPPVVPLAGHPLSHHTPTSAPPVPAQVPCPNFSPCWLIMCYGLSVMLLSCLLTLLSQVSTVAAMSTEHGPVRSTADYEKSSAVFRWD